MSDRVERRLLELLDEPTVSPYGNPIPGLSELGVTPSPVPGDRDAAHPEMRLTDLLDAGVSQVTVTRIGEHPQADLELLAELVENGILPGETVVLEEVDAGVGITGSGRRAVVGREVARHVFGLPSA